jgi:hypothetical protein
MTNTFLKRQYASKMRSNHHAARLNGQGLHLSIKNNEIFYKSPEKRNGQDASGIVNHSDMLTGSHGENIYNIY